MKTTVRDICMHMEEWAPPELAYDWDKVGLHTGDPDRNVTSVLVCLTVTPEALQRARKTDATMIVAHHPLIWASLRHLRDDDPQAKLCVELATRNIACFAAHTNLDIAPGGVNDTLAHRLGLEESMPLFPVEHVQLMKLVTFIPASHVDALRDALADSGAGTIGNYTHCSFQTEGTGCFRPGPTASPFTGHKETLNNEQEVRFEMLVNTACLAKTVTTLRDAHPYEEPAYDLIPLKNRPSGMGIGRQGSLKMPMRLPDFADYVREKLGLHYVQRYGDSKKPVSKIAVLGGSGGSYIHELPGHIDAFVTGDIVYHDAQSALLKGVSCIDAGHAGTENPILEVIQRRLRHKFKNIQIKLFREKNFGTIHQ